MRLLSFLVAAGTASLAFGIPLSASKDVATRSRRTSKMQFFGINESGPEFGTTNIPGTYGTDYIWPNLTTIDTFINKGLNIFRINILMERLIPNEMTGSMDTAYLGNLTETVDYITKNGAYAMIVPHNYGRYYDEIINSTSNFGAFWGTVATSFKDNEKVIFDTNNEYHDMSSSLVQQLNQAAITAIRTAGATSQYITVEGNAYTGAWTWTTSEGTDGKTNADVMANLTDTVDNKLIYQMHQYLDSDGSGTSATCVNSTIGSERLKDATAWLKQNNKIGMVGEFAGGANSICMSAIKDMLSYMNDNNDVWSGALWWAAGPWWGDYIFSMEPADGTSYDYYLNTLVNYS